jgi:hypothetical protein
VWIKRGQVHQYRGVRKRGRVLIEVTLGYDGNRFYFYRTSSSCLTRDYLESVGIEVKKYGCKIRQREIRRKITLQLKKM